MGLERSKMQTSMKHLNLCIHTLANHTAPFFFSIQKQQQLSTVYIQSSMFVALQRLPEMLASSSHQTQVFLSTETTFSMSSKARSMSSPKGTGNNQQRETQGIHHDARCCQHHPGMKKVEQNAEPEIMQHHKNIEWHVLSREHENPPLATLQKTCLSPQHHTKPHNLCI